MSKLYALTLSQNMALWDGGIVAILEALEAGETKIKEVSLWCGIIIGVHGVQCLVCALASEPFKHIQK